MDNSKELLSLFQQIPIHHTPIIDAETRLFFCGSCFSQNIGNFMRESGFHSEINPFGIVFNPQSIATIVSRVVDRKHYSETDLVYHNGLFQSLDHHGSFQHADSGILLSQINRSIDEFHQYLRRCDVAILTPGTAYTWYHAETMKTVSNCHKLPQSAFQKILLSEVEIFNALQIAVIKLQEINPQIKIVFTLSPVKHLRDGIVENALSKARVLSSIHRFLSTEKAEKVMYFPSYEIMTEELRDYRFYAEDGAHISPWATEYIYRRFKKACFSPKALEFSKMAENYLRMKNHRPRTQDATLLAEWKNKIQKLAVEIQELFPDCNRENFTEQAVP